MLRNIKMTVQARPISFIKYMLTESALCLDPPYQRGNVWGLPRKRDLIKSLLIGVPIGSIIINQRLGRGEFSDDYRDAVIDGKQRILAITQFVDGEFSIPGEWVDYPGDVRYPDMPIGWQRLFRASTLSVCFTHVESMEGERQIFDLVNFSGVSQGESDIA